MAKQLDSMLLMVVLAGFEGRESQTINKEGQLFMRISGKDMNPESDMRKRIRFKKIFPLGIWEFSFSLGICSVLFNGG